MAIYRYLDASTSHLTEAEADALHSAPGAAPVRVVSHDYGWWVNVPDAGSDQWRNEDWPEWPSLFRVAQHARARDCNWINLDQDAETLEALPFYKW